MQLFPQSPEHPLIYLDYNATAPLRPEARRAMLAALDATGNPSSVHQAGRRARALVETARQTIAEALAAQPRQVIFTSGGTEANALAFQCAGHRTRLVSAIEHPSLLAMAGSEAVLIPVTRQGMVDLAALKQLLAATPVPAFVSVMAANNETGVLQPIEEVALLVRQAGGVLHVDAAQALGKIDLMGCPADSISLSAHKIGGPQGTGALIIRGEDSPQPLLRGGGQEFGWRAGTENVGGIAGFGAAVQAASDTAWRDPCCTLRDRLEAALPISARLIDPETPRLPTTSLLHMPGVEAALQVMHFDLAGIAVSAGSACSSGKVSASHVLAAMGRTAAQACESIRVSLGWETKAEDIDHFVEAWHRLNQRLGTARAA